MQSVALHGGLQQIILPAMPEEATGSLQGLIGRLSHFLQFWTKLVCHSRTPEP
jgi:hypothetical protein